ncbi:hypothetical protein C8C83_3090 [Flavobacterium sp. 90]|uniref:hypothetical protein n=1 Tax=unclassified Flavobacterium TaxID=196869 RepID=UPI000EB1F107|nr:MULTISPECIES: hypothetical protein [unclassified Flavobacterium]RKR11365.1 hypothetical protein C8C82_3400 [Flavobacterium sp. 81]TCK55146.1 hypothetical protein C8C83_3090 [Flavobacterium sp. 90]
MEFFFNLNIIYKALLLILFTILLFRLCYFFEGFSTFKFFDLVTIFVLLFLLNFIVFKTLNGIYYTAGIKEDYSLTKGEITYYKSGKGRKNRGQVNYDYIVNNELISTAVDENDYVEIPDKKPDTTISYLIIYNKKTPQNSYLLFNYPIREKEDILEYQELFKNGIPDNVFND